MAGTGSPTEDGAQLLWYLFLCPELYIPSLEEFRFPQVDILNFQVHFLETQQEYEMKRFLEAAILLKCFLWSQFVKEVNFTLLNYSSPHCPITLCPLQKNHQTLVRRTQ